MAEFMLRRTRAEQVVPVYRRLTSKYPSVKSLSSANPQTLRHILSSLGLNWRIPAFREVSKHIIKQYRGKIPDSREALLSLPGIGDYVAGAVLSMAFRKKEWIVDTNVVRVFSRYFGIKPKSEGRREKVFIDLAKALADSRNPRAANLAILDLAALICAPRNPDCTRCPLRSTCAYYSRIEKKPDEANSRFQR
jgi:A/G-specific adenine glycosylase